MFKRSLEKFWKENNKLGKGKNATQSKISNIQLGSKLENILLSA